MPNWGNEGKRDTNDTRAVLISGICERSVQIDFDENVTFQAVQHLYNLARSDDKRPFFLQVSAEASLLYLQPLLELTRFTPSYLQRRKEGGKEELPISPSLLSKAS